MFLVFIPQASRTFCQKCIYFNHEKYPPSFTPVSFIQKISGFKYNLIKIIVSFFSTILSAMPFLTCKLHPQVGHSDGTKISTIFQVLQQHIFISQGLLHQHIFVIRKKMLTEMVEEIELRGTQRGTCKVKRPNGILRHPETRTSRKLLPKV